MKIKLNFTIFCALFSTLAFNQSAEDQIRHSIHNYFNGTSYSYKAQIESAFHPDATLYLENKEGKMILFSAAEYAALYDKNTPGVFIGRYNKILSIEIEGNLAQVKAEILIPKSKRRYVDIFIMKETAPDQWQIISKAANSSPMEINE